MLFVSVYLKHLRLLVLCFHVTYVSVDERVCKSFERINYLAGKNFLVDKRYDLSQRDKQVFLKELKKLKSIKIKAPNNKSSLPTDFIFLQGIFITKVLPDGPAATALQAGDKLLEVRVLIMCLLIHPRHSIFVPILYNIPFNIPFHFYTRSFMTFSEGYRNRTSA